jgi:hypothetical protein
MDDQMMILRPDENVLIGNWTEVGGAIDGDETCKRIERLVRDELDEVARSDAGWTTLFVDTNDGRFWERTYPHGDWHGGGPPTLKRVSNEYVRAKYGL